MRSTCEEQGVANILVVEDDDDLRSSMTEYLAAVGHKVEGLASGEALFRRLAVAGADLVILDVGLPGEDGLSITEYLKEQTDIRVVIVSGHNEATMRIAGLQKGADLYLTKPVNFGELELYIASIQRTAKQLQGVGAQRHDGVAALVESGDWSLDTRNWILYFPDGEPLNLTAREYHFVRCLVEGRGATVSKARIAAALWAGRGDFDYKRIDVLVTRLRQKGRNRGRTLPIKTVTAYGYEFSAQCNVLG